MKKVSIFVFILGIILTGCAMITMRIFHFLIPTCIGVFGLMLMMISVDVEDERHDWIRDENSKR